MSSPVHLDERNEMYIKTGDESYWVMNPTLREQSDITTMHIREKREQWYGIWFIGVPVLLAILSFAVLARNGVPGWAMFVPLVLIIIPMVASIIAMIKGNYASTLRRLQNEQRAFAITRSYWTHGRNVADALLQEILLGGSRYLKSMEYRFQVIQQLPPELVNDLLQNSVLVDALGRYSKVSSQEARDAWRTTLEPHAAALIASALPLINQLQEDEKQDAMLVKDLAASQAQQELVGLARFVRDNRWVT